MTGLLSDGLIEEFARDKRPCDDPDDYDEWCTGLTSESAEAMWRAGFCHPTAAMWLQAVQELWEGCSDEAWTADTLASMAQVWALAEFGHEGVLDWAFIASVVGPQEAVFEARRWRAAGFTPRGAAQWVTPKSVFHRQPLDKAREFAVHGWGVTDATFLSLFSKRLSRLDFDDERDAWLESKLAPSDVLDFVRAGVPAASAQVLNEFRDRQALNRELALREADLPPFDRFDAVAINDALFMCFGDEPRGRLWQRAVPDSHDLDGCHSQFQKMFGPSNSDGAYLAKIVEFSAEADEDGWTYAAMYAEGAANEVVARLGLDDNDVDLIIERGGHTVIVRVSEQIDVYVQCRSREGLRPWHREIRDATKAELDRWASS